MDITNSLITTQHIHNLFEASTLILIRCARKKDKILKTLTIMTINWQIGL